MSYSTNSSIATANNRGVILKMAAGGTLTYNRVVTLSVDDANYTMTLSGGGLNIGAIGNATPGTGAFTTLDATVKLGVTSNASGLPTSPSASQYLLHVGNSDGTPAAGLIDGSGAGALLVLRRAEGTIGVPTAVTSGMQIGQIGAAGYGATGYIAQRATELRFVASELFTDTVHGARMDFAVTAVGAATLTVAARLDSNGFNSTAIGATTPSTGAFTTLSASASGLDAFLFGGIAADGVHNFSIGGAGLVRVDGTTTPSINLYAATVLKSQFYWNGTATIIGSYANANVGLQVNNSVVATVTSGGMSVTGTIDSSGGAWFGTAALGTGATTGHVYIQTSAGAPTGVPATKTGQVAIQFDTTNNKLYIYDGGWLSTVALT